MKKVLFLMVLLFLMGLGAASVKAQVRIGGNTPPNASSVLDLNATDATNTGTKPLALPRVNLASTTDLLNNTSLLTGMLVYNTGGSLSTGLYYWNGTNWNRVDGATLGGDTIVGNEILNATANGGLVRSGSGTSVSPYTLGLALKTDAVGTPGTQGMYSEPITWTIAYRGTINCYFTPGQSCVALVAPMGAGYICHTYDSGMYVQAGNGMLRLMDLLNRTGQLSVSLTCFGTSDL